MPQRNVGGAAAAGRNIALARGDTASPGALRRRESSGADLRYANVNRPLLVYE